MRDVTHNNYGFVWGNDILVERTCSNTKPKSYVLRVFDMRGACIEIIMRPRSTKIKRYPKPRNKK